MTDDHSRMVQLYDFAAEYAIGKSGVSGHDTAHRQQRDPVVVGRSYHQWSFTCGSVRRVIKRASVSSATFTDPCNACSCIL